MACSSSLNLWFNWGSILGITLVIQIVSGLFLTLHYNALERYDSIMFIIMEVRYGWLFKSLHSNNASLIFLAIFMHLYKNVMFHSYRLTGVWNTGILMFVIIMVAGFSGYVLVGSQMRLWAAMVITGFIGVVPLVGETLMHLVWGGYSVSWITIQTLLIVHFVLPFAVVCVMVAHLRILHKTGSTRLIYSHRGVEKVTFYPYFVVKDMFNIVFYMGFLVVMLLFPYSLGEVELFEEANFLSSPAHIIPEWYFTTRYAILRRVPSKGVGVLVILGRVAILFLYPLRATYHTPASNEGPGLGVGLFGLQVYLSYLGFSSISQPYVLMALLRTTVYFLYHTYVITINTVVAWGYEVFID